MVSTCWDGGDGISAVRGEEAPGAVSHHIAPCDIIQYSGGISKSEEGFVVEGGGFYILILVGNIIDLDEGSITHCISP